MRFVPTAALFTSVVLLIAGLALASSERTKTSERADVQLVGTADGIATDVRGRLDRGHQAVLLLAERPAFATLAQRGHGLGLGAVKHVLASIEAIDATVADTASFFLLSGEERVRSVDGVIESRSKLARDASTEPFFEPTLSLAAGAAYESPPYVSTVTDRLVISESTVVRSGEEPIGILRLEVPVSPARSTAADGTQVGLVDPRTGTFTTLSGIRRSSAFTRLIGVEADAGVLETDGHRLAYRRLSGGTGASWLIVASVPVASVLTTNIPIGPLLLVAGAVALSLVGMLMRKRARREHALALVLAQEARAEAERRSLTDALTQLFNRRHMVDAISAELSRAGRGGPAPIVLLLDVDHFKRINDIYGHGAGDEVLVEVADRLRSRMRGYDVIGRWGGEEFIVLVPGVGDDETFFQVAEDVRRLIGSVPFTVTGDTTIPVTVSIGAARASESLRTAEAIVDAADRALYAAKRRGRDRTQLFGDLTVEDFVAEEPEALRLARALALSSSARESLPKSNGEQVASIATAIAEQLDLAGSMVMRCRLGSWLRDLGAVSIPDRLLQLVGPADAVDRALIENHVVVGEQIVRSVAGLSEAADAVRHHHERFDGTGYPDRLDGDQIPLEARIVAVAAAYIELVSLVPRFSPSIREAILAHLEADDGARFDPAVVRALADALHTVDAPTASAA